MQRPILWIFVAVVLVGAGLYAWQKSDNGPFGPNDEQFQAVFLANGQVYFGKFSDGSAGPRLTDIYYLQVQQPIQPEDVTNKPDVKLVKLGTEVHGPQDTMRINRDQILFIEDLKESGKVVTAIREHQVSAEDNE